MAQGLDGWVMPCRIIGVVHVMFCIASNTDGLSGMKSFVCFCWNGFRGGAAGENTDGRARSLVPERYGERGLIKAKSYSWTGRTAMALERYSLSYAAYVPSMGIESAGASGQYKKSHPGQGGLFCIRGQELLLVDVMTLGLIQNNKKWQ